MTGLMGWAVNPCIDVIRAVYAVLPLIVGNCRDCNSFHQLITGVGLYTRIMLYDTYTRIHA